MRDDTGSVLDDVVDFDAIVRAPEEESCRRECVDIAIARAPVTEGLRLALAEIARLRSLLDTAANLDSVRLGIPDPPRSPSSVFFDRR